MSHVSTFTLPPTCVDGNPLVLIPHLPSRSPTLVAVQLLTVVMPAFFAEPPATKYSRIIQKTLVIIATTRRLAPEHPRSVLIVLDVVRVQVQSIIPLWRDLAVILRTKDP